VPEACSAGIAGGTENADLFATVRGSIPNRRAVSRPLIPSTINRSSHLPEKLSAFHLSALGPS